MKKVDLHMHSEWSDGSMSVPDIVTLSKRLGLDVISITDHDTAEHLPEAMAEGERQGVRVVPGAELSAYDAETGRKIHILCYLPTKPDLITDACRPYLEKRRRTNRDSVERIRAAGYPIDTDDVERYVGRGGVLHRQHVMHALCDRGYTNTIYGELYDKLYGKNGIATARSRYMTAEDAVKLSLDAGGLPVLAHPFQYDSMDALPRLARRGLRGIELIHHTQTPERREIVAEAAARYGLFTTGGTDFHGMYSEKPMYPGMLETL
ncbi:MAG: PHP domain-containing protein, partial [Oscillospiraceae bacterium]|nr:PHP domain-containing protein [Oscillospiraceae bacterium]